MSTEIIRHESSLGMEKWSGAAARGLEARREREQIVAEVLSPEIDYGLIPGCGDRPALKKPGAEKIADSLNLWPEYEDLGSVQDYASELFVYRYRCILRQRGSDSIVATGIGSCNSKESKYRWRNIPAFKATEAEVAAAERKVIRRSKAGNDVEWIIIPNDDICSLVNTIDKMAQKRALVAAALNLGFSDHFTQDVEDNPEAFGGEPEESTAPARPAVKQPQRKAQPPPTAKQDGNVWIGQIASCTVLRTGETARGPWTLYSVKGADGTEFRTFSSTEAKDATEMEGMTARIEWKPSTKGQGKDIVTIEVHDEGGGE